ncbi:hypothetical protein M413DRAFT_29841 [Hebeloma cylindrosporum]|uniref:Xylanolytic transcriptional activator regulatory domain-containing protein n=1 Tax=Hebeloma cylindrosporum TaxID=76867 RepID=A0A0C3BQI9_HEBCY|nr:hypothetical protein M413DRAFT_29841 [Hebeloma cylindrosporum h7]
MADGAVCLAPNKNAGDWTNVDESDRQRGDRRRRRVELAGGAEGRMQPWEIMIMNAALVYSSVPPSKSPEWRSPRPRTQNCNVGSTILVKPIKHAPQEYAPELLSHFFPYGTQLGLFLNIPRFKESFFQWKHIGHSSRPAPALIYATYLWAIRLSPDERVKQHEHSYLHQAIEESVTILSGSHPDKFLHSIQTEVLLATYFFTKGNFEEGRHRLSKAVLQVFSFNLHKIRSSDPWEQQPTDDETDQRNPVEEGEKILGLWTVLALDKLWAIATTNEPHFKHPTHESVSKVDTPWPPDMEDFEKNLFPQHVRTAGTIHYFIAGVKTDDSGISSRAIEAKAAILWERINFSARTCSANAELFSKRFSHLKALLDDVFGSLPSRDPQTIMRIQPAEQALRWSFANTILNTAAIQLHAPFALADDPNSKKEQITAARAILNMVIAMRGSGREVPHLNPIIGIAWSEASEVLFKEVEFIRFCDTCGIPYEGDECAILYLIQQAVSGFTRLRM